MIQSKRKLSLVIRVAVVSLLALAALLVIAETLVPLWAPPGFLMWGCVEWGKRFIGDGRDHFGIRAYAPFMGNEQERVLYSVDIESDSICGYLPWAPFLPQNVTLLIPTDSE